MEILGRKGSGTMIFIVRWCYGGLAMVIFILFWQGSYPPWWHHTGILHSSQFLCAGLKLTLILHVSQIFDHGWQILIYFNSHRLCRPEVAVLRGACFNMKDRVRRPLTAFFLHLSENLMSDLFVFRYISASFIVESISRHSAGRGSQRSPNPIQ